MVSHDWWETLFFTLSGHMTCQNASVCQPRQRQRSFWGSLENNNATSICKDNETNGRGAFQPGAIICWGCLHHNNWGSCRGRNSRPKCKRLIMLPFPAMSPGKLRKCMSEWKCKNTLKRSRVFPIWGHTECWKGVLSHGGHQFNLGLLWSNVFEHDTENRCVFVLSNSKMVLAQWSKVMPSCFELHLFEDVAHTCVIWRIYMQRKNKCANHRCCWGGANLRKMMWGSLMKVKKIKCGNKRCRLPLECNNLHVA